MHRTLSAAIMAATLFSVCLADPVCAGKPIPCGKNASISSTFLKQNSAWRQRTVVDAYKKVADPSAKWKTAGQEFLEYYCLYAAQGKGSPTAQEVAERGKAVIDSGCDDPLVQSCYGICLVQCGLKAEAAPPLTDAFAGFQNSPYPKCRGALVVPYLIEARTAANTITDEDRTLWTETWIRWICEATTDGSFGSGESRLMTENLLLGVANGPIVANENLYNALKNHAGADPYFVNIVGGQTQIKEGWADRGDGWADSVSDEAWDAFYAHLDEAKALLTVAWKTHPEYPEAPALMITAAMPEEHEKCRVWLDRAVAAEMDYMPAYRKFAYCSLPRWGGSIAELRSLARECLRTGRFDTAVPMMYHTISRTIWKETKGKSWRPNARQVAEFKTLFYGYGLTGFGGKSQGYYKSCYASVLWSAGRNSEANNLIKALGSGFESQSFEDTVGYTYAEARKSLAGDGLPFKST